MENPSAGQKQGSGSLCGLANEGGFYICLAIDQNGPMIWHQFCPTETRLILGLGPANESQLYYNDVSHWLGKNKSQYYVIKCLWNICNTNLPHSLPCLSEFTRLGCYLNIKMLFYNDKDSQYKYKTISWPSYHYNWNTHTRKDNHYIEMGPRCLF